MLSAPALTAADEGDPKRAGRYARGAMAVVEASSGARGPHRRRAPRQRADAAERRVLELLPTEMTLAEIAEQLFLSRNTVKSHVRRLYARLGQSSRADAVAAARERGLL